MAITVGTLIVDLEANTASFVSGLDKAGQMSLNSAAQMRRAFTEVARIAAASFLAVEAAVSAAVEHSISNAARLYGAAQATGTTTAALSALEYAAKQSGLSAEQLDKGLEKMAKSALAAASAGRDGQSAYRTLGISVTDLNGKLRPTQDILGDVAAKFARMPDGPMKTALALQLFGRAGAELVPLLNRGRDGIADLMDEARQLGVVIDDDTARAAKHFEDSMTILKSRAEGAANALTTQLLPALNFTLDRMNQSPPSGGWVNVTAKTLIGTVGVLRTWLDYLQSIGALVLFVGGETVAVFNAVGAAGIGLSKALVFDFAGARREYTAGYRGFLDQLQTFSRDWKSIWSDNRSFLDGLFEKPVPSISAIADRFMRGAGKTSAPTPPSGDAGATEKAAAALRMKIEALENAARAELREAAAQQGDTAATWLAIAAIKAQQQVDDLNAKAKEKHIAALTAEQEAQIRSAEVLRTLGSKFNEINRAMADEILRTNQQTSAIRAMAEAYAQGGAAMARAEEEAKLEPFREKVRQAQLALDEAKRSGDKFSKETLADLATAALAARQELDGVTRALQAEGDATRESTTERLVTDTYRWAASQRSLAEALLRGTAAMEEQFLVQKRAEFTADKTQDQSKVEQYIAALRAQLAVQRLLGTEESLDFSRRRRDTADQIEALRRLRAQLIANGATETEIDAQIHALEQQKLRDYVEEQLQLGNTAAGVRAFFAEFTKGKDQAQRVYDLLRRGFDDLESNIAKALTGQKVAWADFLRSIAEELTKLMLHRAFQALFGLLGGGGGIFGSLFGGFGGGRASGGPVQPGQWYITGETEPEIFAPDVPGTIIPVSALAAAGGGGTQQTVINQYQTINIQTPDANSFRQSREQITNDMAAAGAAAARRK